MGSATNREVIERLADAWNVGYSHFFSEVTASTFRGHETSAGGMNGLDAYMALLQRATECVSRSSRVELEKLVAEGESVAARFAFSGTNTGPLLTRPESTGNATKFEGMELYHIVDGKIIEWWDVHDRCAMFQQLGLSCTQTRRTDG